MSTPTPTDHSTSPLAATLAPGKPGSGVRESTKPLDATSGEPAPLLPGARLGYLTKMFPRVSETFILKEVLALKRAGVPVTIYSTLPPTRDRLIQPEAQALLPEVRVLPQVGWTNRGAFIRALEHCRRTDGRATLKAVIRYLRQPSQRRFRRLWRGMILAHNLHQDRITHLHAAWAHTPASVARDVSRLTGIPWSMAAHAKDIYLSNPESIRKKVTTASFVLTCTGSNRRLLRTLAELGPDEPMVKPKVELHYDGVDTQYFSPAKNGNPPSPPLILSVGRLVPKKGFEILLEAALLLRCQGIPFHLQIVGEGPLRSDLEERIRHLDLEDCVELTGMLVLPQVRERYRNARCMVLASRITDQGDRDGIPNTLAEAMACGVPVIASHLPSIRELVVDTESGLLVPPEDPAALARALSRVLTDDDLHCTLAKGGRKRVVKRFAAEFHEQQTVNRLRRALGIERVLYVSADRGVPVRGHKGASVHVRSVLKSLGHHEVDAVVVTARPGPKDGPVPGARLIKSGSSAATKRRVKRLYGKIGGAPLEKAILRVLDNWNMYRAMRELIRSWRPQAIYERYALTAIAGSLIARRLRVPHILEVNAPLADEEARFRGLRLGWLAHHTERWVLRRADRVVVVSEELRGFAERVGVPADRILVMPNVIDPTLFNPDCDGQAVRDELGLQDRFVIGFSGTLKPWHGLHHLLQSVALGGERLAHAHILVIGDGPCRDELTALAAELGLAERITFLGSIAHDEVGRYLAASDVLVAPYGPLEDFWFSPLKVAEYQAVGRPVVASRIGQLASELGDSGGVALVPPGDESALAETMSRLAHNPEHRERMARAAAQADVWTWDRLTGQVLREVDKARRQGWGWPHV